ncbi:hypothetical protein HYT01_02590 [Candidatus Giovannonibacteria bacterium]|nr:hypothetical protein [Candidatus Giovannonibacteria bacterium]
MPLQKNILVIGTHRDIGEFDSILRKEGFKVDVTESFEEAFKIAKETSPEAIIFMLPVYWQSITDFVKKAGTSLPKTEFIYIGSLIEGGDQAVLQQFGVKTFTLGPVPKEEIVRYITKLLW